LTAADKSRAPGRRVNARGKTEMTDVRTTAHADRAGVLAVYLMLLAAPFTFGVLAWVALGLAWFRRGIADEVARSHYRHQIRSFVDDAVVLVLSIVVGWTALAGGVGSLIGFTGAKLPFGLQPAHLGAWTVALVILWLALWLYGFIGLIVGSVRGVLRLSRGQAI
jgi:uncharacterized membrane protein